MGKCREREEIYWKNYAQVIPNIAFVGLLILWESPANVFPGLIINITSAFHKI